MQFTMFSARVLVVAFMANLCWNTFAELTNTLHPRSMDCSCGFQDPTTLQVFTEATIAYFNETTGVLQDFGAEVYTNDYEKSWNAVYRQGADAKNVLLNTTSNSLELVLSPPEGNHVVYGGGIRTLRSDIQFGSFRSLFRPSSPYNGGSAISMSLKYNTSQSIGVNVMNTDKPDTAWTSLLIGEEFPDRKLGANFSTADFNSTSSVSSWGYSEYRIDWLEKDIKWFIGSTLVRTASKHNLTIPSVPMPIFLKHWSTGNKYAEQGPPLNGAVANAGYTRLFFNSSLMDAATHEAFDTRCQSISACSTEDLMLRGSTPYVPEALQRWKQSSSRTTFQWIAIWMAVVCIICTTLLLMHTLIPRILNRLRKPKRDRSDLANSHADNNEGDLATQTIDDVSAYGGPYLETDDLKHDPEKVLHHMRTVGMSNQSASDATMSFTSGSTTWARPDTKHSLSLSMTDRKLAFWQQGGSARSVVSLKLREPGDDSFPGTPTPQDSRLGTANGSPMPSSPINSRATTMVNLPLGRIMAEEGVGCATRLASIESARSSTDTKKGKGKKRRVSILVAQEQEKPPSVGSNEKEPLTSKSRVEYLAGLTAMCAIIVSVDHFCATFVPAVIFPGAPHHYISEVWANKIVTPYLMNQIWIGVFFTCSTRFLVSRYLKAGELEWIANKAVTRNFRVMIPIIAVAMLEYFLMECGATNWLEYLPSITWSTWPYTTPYNSFGEFVSEVLEIVYLVPNAAPKIIFNYCTGVLWTMPIQLQGSWIILLGVVVIYEIKNPFKRFGYYAFAVIFNWYASSWGTYFWLGMLLADIDIVFKYQKHIAARPWLFYLLTITYGLVTILSLSVDTINQVASYSFVDAEHSIHPDPWSGLPIYKANPLAKSDYFVPKLNGITFAFSLQSLIELSPFFQNVFSCKPLTLIFPHIFTIYLFHGLIFWSLGAVICVFLSTQGLAYGLNLFIVAICCYAALIFSLPIVTPIVELLGKHWTASIWRSASEAPPPKRDTLFPFAKTLLSEDRDSSPNNDDDEKKYDEKKFESDLDSKPASTTKSLEKKHAYHTSETITEVPIGDYCPPFSKPSSRKQSHDKTPSSGKPSYERPTTAKPSFEKTIPLNPNNPFADPPSPTTPSSSTTEKDNSSKGLDYLRELEKRQNQSQPQPQLQQRTTSAQSTYSTGTGTGTTSSLKSRSSMQASHSLTHQQLTSFPESEDQDIEEVEIQYPASTYHSFAQPQHTHTQVQNQELIPPSFTIQKPSSSSHPGADASNRNIVSRTSTRSSSSSLLASAQIIYAPNSTSHTHYTHQPGHRRSDTTSLSRTRSQSQSQSVFDGVLPVALVGERGLRTKLSVSEVRELALVQARESREAKRDKEIERAFSLTSDSSSRPVERLMTAGSGTGRLTKTPPKNKDTGKAEGKGKGKEKDGNKIDQGFMNVYGVESPSTSSSSLTITPTSISNTKSGSSPSMEGNVESKRGTRDSRASVDAVGGGGMGGGGMGGGGMGGGGMGGGGMGGGGMGGGNSEREGRSLTHGHEQAYMVEVTDLEKMRDENKF